MNNFTLLPNEIDEETLRQISAEELGRAEKLKRDFENQYQHNPLIAQPTYHHRPKSPKWLSKCYPRRQQSLLQQNKRKKKSKIHFVQ